MENLMDKAAEVLALKYEYLKTLKNLKVSELRKIRPND